MSGSNTTKRSHAAACARVVAFALLAGASACGRGPASVDDPVVAQVAGAPVVQSEIVQAFAERQAGLGATGVPPSAQRALWASALNDVLLAHAVQAAAQARHIVVLHDEIDGALQRFAAPMLQDDTAGPTGEAAASGEPLALGALQQRPLRDAVRQRLLMAKYLAQEVTARIEVSDEEIDQLAAAQPELLQQPARVRLRLLRVADEAQLALLKKALQKGVLTPNRWPQSDAMQIVDAGLIAVDALPHEVQQRIASLPVGRLSAPWPVAGGWLLAWLSDRQPAAPQPLAQARRRLERRLREQKEQEAEQQALRELMQAAHVEVFDATMPTIR